MALDTAKATVTLRTLTKKFDNRLQSASPLYPSVCTVIPSDGYDEAYGMLGNMPGMQEWLGDRKFQELRAANFTIANKHWESSLLIKKTDIADDRMMMYGPLMEQLAIEAAFHPDELFFTALVNGESTACFDGQYFFDTDHAWGDSGTQSNDLTYAAATGTAPTAAEFRAAFHQARTKMLQYKNDQGKFLNRPTVGRMSDLLLLVPPEQELAAFEGLTAPVLSNNTNVVLDVPRIVVCPQLTDATKFYLFNMGGVLRPMVFQAREALSRQMKGLDDIETKDVKFMTEARYNVGYLAWWTAVLTTWT
jgi:phage major head subunit gpT-like protein